VIHILIILYTIHFNQIWFRLQQYTGTPWAIFSVAEDCKVSGKYFLFKTEVVKSVELCTGEPMKFMISEQSTAALL